MTEWIKYNPDKEEKKESKYLTKKKHYIKRKKKEEPEEPKKWITSKYDKKRPQGGWGDRKDFKGGGCAKRGYGTAYLKSKK